MAEEVEDTQEVSPYRRSVRPMDMEEKAEVLRLYFKERKTITDIAKELGRKHETISKFIRTMTDSTQVAQQFLKAKAFELTKRVVEKANVDQAIEILSRPNVGVLEPHKKGNDAPQIMISVNTESIGAVVMPVTGPNSSDTPILPPSDAPAKLIGAGRTYNDDDEQSGILSPGVEVGANGGEGGEAGYDVPVDASGGLRGASAPAGPPEGPSGVEQHSGDVGSGRQGRLATPLRAVQKPSAPVRVGFRGPDKAQKDEPRTAILNKARPRSSINLRYPIETEEEGEE